GATWPPVTQFHCPHRRKAVTSYRRDAGVGRPGAVVDGHATEELRAGAREVVRGGGDVGPGVGEALGEGRCAGGKSEHYMALVEMPGALIAFRAATRRNANKF